MRLLNSVCKVIASAFKDIPVHIEEVPKHFERGCFYVCLTTEGTELLNTNVYQDTPIFQIVYFGKRNAAGQVYAEKLYDVKESLKRLFLLNKALPVLPLEGVEEKLRYAKYESYSDELRISEGAIYARLAINFTEDIPQAPNEYEPIGEVDIITQTKILNG